VTIWTLKCPIPLVNAVHSDRSRPSATKHEFRLTLTLDRFNASVKANDILYFLWGFLHREQGEGSGAPQADSLQEDLCGAG
jgi:hypothetical protein